MKSKQIFIDLYQQTINIIICDDFYKHEDSLPKLNNEDWDFSGYSERIGNDNYILLSSKYGYDYMLSTAVHEAFHVSNFIMKHVGIKPDVNNDEAQAYLLTYIFEQIYKLINND